MKEQNYHISIVMPVYNVERYLPQCMDTIFAQTLKEIEIIAVNDGSTDKSLLILEEYQQKAPDRVRIFTIPNGGVSHARNYGMERASGEYLLFVDSDDFLEPDMCEKLYLKAKQDGNDLVICGRYNVYEKEHIGQYVKEAAGTQLINHNFNLRGCKFELAHISPFPWDKLFKKSLLKGLAFPEKLRFEDLVLVYEAACKADSIGVVEEPLYNYRRTTQGGFLNSLSEQTLDITKSFTIMFEYMKQNHYWEEYYEELEYICARHFLFRYGTLFKPENKGKLQIKRTIIKSTQSFLDQNLPGWRDNHYLKYSAAPELKKKLKLYTREGKLLRRTVLREYTPDPVIGLCRNAREFAETWKKRIIKWRKSRNKLELLKKKFPFLTLLRRNAAVYYTKMYLKRKVDPKLILLESKHGEDLAGNIFALLKELSGEQYEIFHVGLVMEPMLEPRYRELLADYGIYNITFIDMHTKQYLQALATAKYLITDTSFPPYFIKKKEQLLLNTWHGTPLKAMGRVVPDREYALGNVQRNFLISDFLLYQNDFSKEIFLRDYMLEKIYPGTVITSGYPRNSVFFNQNRYERIRQECQMKDSQVIAYMPTWRGLLHQKENAKQIKQLTEYFEFLDEKLKDNQIFFVKLHSFVKDEIYFESFRHIREFPKAYETYDFLNACDVLVTDYSSIMFDFGVTKRKMILFVYDRKEYLADRGLYLTLEELELPKAETVEELMEEINREPKSYPEFTRRFCSYDSSDTAKKVLALLLDQHMQEGQQPDTNNRIMVDIPFKLEKIETGKKKRVLIFINGIRANDNGRRLIHNINSIDTDRYDVFVCMKSEKVKNATQMLSKLKKEIGYFPLGDRVNYTRTDYILCRLQLRFGLRLGFRGERLSRVANREIEKLFGSLHFDYVIHHSDEDVLTAMMCQKLADKCIYNFKYFDYKSFQGSSAYRRKVRRYQKLFPRYDKVVVTKEYNLLKKKAENVIMNEDAGFPFVKILKEVDE